MEYTLIIPYYNQPLILKRQIEEIEQYPKNIKTIIVDDGSEIEAEAPENIQIYRIIDKIEWNRGGARNLGALQAETDWIIHIDIDHILPVKSAQKLIQFKPNPQRWYRFNRFRVGQADETRKKDKIHHNSKFGQIHPHIDSYLVTKEVYWKAGGYDEDYSGCLGGGSPFLEQLGKTAAMEMLPEEICLHVYTSHAIEDANTQGLSRDTSEYRRRREMIGRLKGKNPIRFEWERIQ